MQGNTQSAHGGACGSACGDVGSAGTQASQERAQGAQRARVPKRALHGVLLLDKPLGLSSNDALQKVRRFLRAEKAGHTGTLDPMATGVLPICLGAATKFSQVHLDADKSYEAVALLGVKTTTGDAEGVITQRRSVSVSAEHLSAVEALFTGSISQLPPMYSALKRDGRALYEYARRGVEIERERRAVRIHALTLRQIGQAELDLSEQGLRFGASALTLPRLEGGEAVSERTTQEQQKTNGEGSAAQDVDANNPLTLLLITVRCSKGTYIRTLAEDIGEALGCGACLCALRRTATGAFDTSMCVSLEALSKMSPAELHSRILAPEVLLSDHAVIELEAGEAGRFLSGLRRKGEWPDCERVAVYGKSPRALLGTAHTVGGELIARRLLNVNEIQTILDQTAEKQHDTSN